ncbi:MAG: hypothetical protein HN929_10680 [Chloroflexi bacterium]|jgi:hypothetical protein|nr:hypothetical protein [Chloroflexota bacterium]MBT7081909.1 hypothetical protein [Chloroflexota bacterium]MBT7289820.1 hypothetical protein [Chloroflexota bacterium]
MKKMLLVLSICFATILTMGACDLFGGSSLDLKWTGFDDFEGSTVYVVLKNTSENELVAEAETVIDADGNASLSIAGGSGGANMLYYYVDGNDNGVCDTNGSDVLRWETLSEDIVGRSMQYFSLTDDDPAVADHFN